MADAPPAATLLVFHVYSYPADGGVYLSQGPI